MRGRFDTYTVILDHDVQCIVHVDGDPDGGRVGMLDDVAESLSYYRLGLLSQRGIYNRQRPPDLDSYLQFGVSARFCYYQIQAFSKRQRSVVTCMQVENDTMPESSSREACNYNAPRSSNMSCTGHGSEYTVLQCS